MQNSTKGLLLSGLVLPGLGQLVFKRYVRGSIFIVAVMGGLVVIMLKVAQTALDIVERMGPATNVADFSQMYTETNQAVTEINTAGYAIALLIIVVAWIMSAIDAYLIGRQLDSQSEGRRQSGGTPSGNEAL